MIAAKAKPDEVRSGAPQLAPYHRRLDWLMWALPRSPRDGDRWFVPFLVLQPIRLRR